MFTSTPTPQQVSVGPTTPAPTQAVMQVVTITSDTQAATLTAIPFFLTSTFKASATAAEQANIGTNDAAMNTPSATATISSSANTGPDATFEAKATHVAQMTQVAATVAAVYAATHVANTQIAFEAKATLDAQRTRIAAVLTGMTGVPAANTTQIAFESRATLDALLTRAAATAAAVSTKTSAAPPTFTPTPTSANVSSGDTLRNYDELRYGDSGVATFDPTQSQFQFTFRGTAGDEVYIEIQTLSDNINPLIQLLDTDQRDIASNNFFLETSLPETGEYTIVVTNNSTRSGSFMLSLDKIEPAEATEEPFVTNTPTSISSSADETATAQNVVIRDLSGNVLGDGEVRLFTPASLRLGKADQIRIEIQVTKPNTNYIAISNLSSFPTTTPDLRVRPTATQSPLLDKQFIVVREYMDATLEGIDIKKFNIDALPPSGTRHITDPDKIQEWKWDIETDDKAAIGTNRLQMVVYLSDAANNRYGIAAFFEFTIEVIDPFAITPVPTTAAPTKTGVESAALAAPAAQSNIQAGSATPLPNSSEEQIAATPLPLPNTPVAPQENGLPQNTPTLPTSGNTLTANGSSPLGLVIGLIVVIVVVITGVVVIYRRGQHRPSAFISYRRIPSAALATLIAKELQHQGISVFVDTRSIDGGGLFPKRLIEAIQSNDVFVCLVGDSTFESDWVKEEIQQANTIGKTMIPVFQESWQQLEPKPAPVTDHIKALLNSDGIQMFDRRNVYMDVAIEDLARMIRATAQRR